MCLGQLVDKLQIMKVSTLKKKFKNQWVLAEVLKEDELNRVIEVKPLVHSRDRAEIYDALSEVKKNKHVTTIFTGELPPKGMVYSFYGHSPIRSES